jgi:hypothetical protein
MHEVQVSTDTFLLRYGDKPTSFYAYFIFAGHFLGAGSTQVFLQPLTRNHRPTSQEIIDSFFLLLRNSG